MTQQKRLTFFTASYGQISSVFPVVVIAPAFFNSRLQLGFLTQTASAFERVQGAFSFFINAYRDIAEWRAVVDRLAGFDRAIAAGRAAATTPPMVKVVSRDAAGVALERLEVRLPSGAPLVSADDVTIKPGASVLVTGPSGSGKSTLFRALAGIWPFGSGAVIVPKQATVMMLPQRPYLPVGSLIAAVTYPSLPGRFDEVAMRDALRAVGLPALAERLAEEAHWNRMLSFGEQQRQALARAILHAPDYLFLDEATASLDEPAEAALYRLLHERLPDMTVVSIGHRSTLAAFHRRHLVLERAGERYHMRERAMEAAAS
jgi:putative ATP-binding cassette transporter